MSKESNIKERFKQAILSTAKVISDDYKINIDKKPRSQIKPSDHTPIELELN